MELVGFKRMALNNVLQFTFTPTEPIQMILGTNGSGKSSLIGELTPLPPDPSAYLKEGSKTIMITHRGNSYTLKSTFSPTTKHSFVENGEELNDGGTMSAQLTLVRQKFKITPQIHELLTGLERFHGMSPSKRREWFTELSDISYDYALLVFGRLKERSRDLSGALKLARKRLVSESSKVISDSEETKLRADVEATHRELNLLIEQSAPLDRPVDELKQDYTHGLDELSRLSRKLLNTRNVAPNGTHFDSITQIDQFIDEIRHEITGKETLLNKAVGEHSKLEETVRVLMRTGEAGLRQLQERMAGVREKKKDILAKRKLGIEGLNASNASSALESIYDLLSAILAEIPENSDKRYSQARLNECNAALLTAKDARAAHVAKLTKLNANKAHMEVHKSSGSLTCPNCGHGWILGYSDEKYQALLDAIATAEQETAGLDLKIQEAETEIAAIGEYSAHYGDYVRCVRNWPALAPFWDYLLESGYVTKAPRVALTILETFREDLELERQASALDGEVAEIAELIRATEQVGDASLAESQEKLNECTLSIESLTSELTELRSKLTEYNQYRKQLTDTLELGQRINALMIYQEKLNSDLIESIRRETLNHCVRQLQHSLAIKQETLSAAVLQKGIVTDLEHQIEILAVDEEAAKLLVKNLSPTDGLIAEGLLGFIRNFTGQMNTLIRKIWSYPLQILECGISSAGGAELDYKFPMMVQNKGNIVSDVKFGSSGMREIIDLAFKVVAMRYLDLSESPLYLDEFGASFDEAHRGSATAVIKNLMDQQPFTQLFMVSHYESSYGAFTNAEICVLCPNNITVPVQAKYNQHVVIA